MAIQAGAGMRKAFAMPVTRGTVGAVSRDPVQAESGMGIRWRRIGMALGDAGLVPVGRGALVAGRAEAFQRVPIGNADAREPVYRGSDIVPVRRPAAPIVAVGAGNGRTAANVGRDERAAESRSRPGPVVIGGRRVGPEAASQGTDRIGIGQSQGNQYGDYWEKLFQNRLRSGGNGHL